MLVFGCDLDSWDEHIGEVFDEDVFAEGCVAVEEFCLLEVFIGFGFELVDVVVDKAGGSLDELPLAKWVWVFDYVPTTILLNFFIFLLFTKIV